ncbi:MAG: hypothetical protein GY809_14270 [Planctomycetes bacterium]|nr:hypothetical protein [Planctomycetota bacterium]
MIMLDVCIAGLPVVHAGAGPAGAIVMEPILPMNAPFPVAINEIMASNATTHQDPQGQYDDWVEITNVSDSAVDVGGMYLTDDESNPTQWRFPTDQAPATTIPGPGYLIVWLDKHVDSEGLHANFKLNAQGDVLTLIAPDGVTPVDQVRFGPQEPDIALGRFPDGSTEWTQMGAPTPGTENMKAYEGFLDEVTFSHARGFYDDPVTLSLSTLTEGATIRYTLDGRDPAGGLDGRYGQAVGTVYQGPISITTTTCVRAFAEKSGWKPSRAVSHTYFFLADVATQPRKPQGYPSTWGSVIADYQMDPEIVNDPQYADRLVTALASLPSMSIVMSVADMFGDRGIYTHSGSGGVNWERPASVEMAYPGGQEGFQTDCGIRIQGGAFRNPGASRKHSFRLLFKGQYGSTKLRYPLFGREAADEFDTITLRAGANDGYVWNAARGTEQYTRDEFIRDLQRDAGQASPNGIFVHLYVNGLYWGLYNPVERPDDAFSASYYGGDKEDWDVFRHKNFARNAGDTDALMQLRLDCATVGPSNEAYQRLQGNNPDGTPNPGIPHLLDVPNYIDYMIVNYWGGNWDWPWNNYWLARERTPGSTGFKFYSWDAEDVMGSPRSYLTIDKINNPDPRDVGEFHAQLAGNPEYQLLFADRVHRLFLNEGILTPDALVDRYTRMAQEIELAMITESARWGDQHHHPPVSLHEWAKMRDWIIQVYLPQRSDIVFNQFRQAGLYPDLAAPVFHLNDVPKFGGHVATSEALSMTGDGAIWYTLDGSDPRIPGQAGVLEQTVILEDSAPKRVLVPVAHVNDAWKGGQPFDDSDWIAGSGGVGYELGAGYEDYFTVDLLDQMFYMNATCYIRIPFELSADASQWAGLVLRVRYDDGFAAYLNGVEVARAQAPDVLSWDAMATEAHHDSAAVEFQEFSITGSSDALMPGQNILAIHALNNENASTDFLLCAELVGVEAGSLRSIGISPSALQYAGPMTLAESGPVTARVLSDNQWSPVNQAVYAVGPVAENLRITELMYHPDPPDTEFIELTNTGPEPISLNLVRFTDGIEFTFPPVELLPHDSVVVVEDIDAFENHYGQGFNVAGQYRGSLSNGGETLTLQDAAGLVIQSFEYDDTWHPSTDGAGFSLTLKDPLTDPNSLWDPAMWHASTMLGGSPGY